MKKALIFYIFLLLCSATGCDVEGLYRDDINVRTVVRLESGLAFLEGDPGRVLFVEMAQDGVEVKKVFEARPGEEIISMQGGPDPQQGTQLFIMTTPEDPRETTIDEALFRVDPVTGATHEFAIGSVFGGLSFDPTQRYAILYHQDSDATFSGGLFNPNEVAVIDLQGLPATDNPRILSVGISGLTIQGVHFMDSLVVDGVTRQIVVFGADGVIKMIDLTDPLASTVKVPLVNEDDPRSVVPIKIVARPADDAHDPMIFVLASESQDIYAISLVPHPKGEPGFWASLNQYDGGSNPSDIAVVEDGDIPLLIVASSSGSHVTVVDVDTADMFTLTLNDSPSRMLVREQEGSKEVVLFGDNLSWIYFLAVDDLAIEKGSNLDEMIIPDGIAESSVLDVDRLLIIPYYETGLALLNLNEREVTRLTSQSGYDWTGATMFNDVFFLGQPGGDQIVSLDMVTGHPEPLILDEQVQRLDLFPQSNTGFVLHPTETGRGTLFPLDLPTRENAIIVDGFWLEGFLDKKEATE
jgi:hypothetical protein